MELTPEMIAKLQEGFSKAKTYEDLMGKEGVIKKLLASSIENLLDAELTEHLGYEKHSPAGDHSGNSRNGYTKKTLKNDQGEIELSIPRDRNGEYEPVLIKKYQRTLGAIEDKIISMYAKGMTTRDIQTHIEELYGVDMSPTMISNITERVVDHIHKWQSRALEEVYAFAFFDAIYFKVRENGKVLNKAAYTCLTVDLQGQKDMLGIWIGDAEGAHFWSGIMSELQARGVKDILIASVDGLKGLPDAIHSVFPKTTVQLCVIHQIRSSMRYVASKDQKVFMAALKKVYTSASREEAEYELERLDETWGKKYLLAVRSWKENWEYIANYFQFAPEIRKIMYTTNAVESLHRPFRKVTKSRAQFPTDDALKKMLYLAYRDIRKKWNMAAPNWVFVLAQLTLVFDDRVKKYL
jgi:putative transposase